MINKKLLCSAVLLLGSNAAYSVPMNFSFTGNFSQDDDVQLFNFSTDGATTAYFVSYGYGGGTQADGNVVSHGGFDTILTLFDAAGNFIDDNDDGSGSCFTAAAGIGGSSGNADPNTGSTWDTCFSSMLAAGDYILAVTQYDNFAADATLGDGFENDGTGNFTAGEDECTQGSFCDVSGTPIYTNRTNFWAYDILNVEGADVVDPTIPEPATLALMGLGLAGLGAARRRKAA